MTIKVLFVCLGNICRSPTAHGVFEQTVAKHQLSGHILVDSAGTGGWHIGETPDSRATSRALTRGYDLSQLRARQVCLQDFNEFDYILAMDHNNLAELQAIAPADYHGELTLFLNYSAGRETDEVPDPYYGNGDGFEYVLQLVERASKDLLQNIIERHRLLC